MENKGQEKDILKEVTEAYRRCPFIMGIVLGGSRATGTATAQSDIDIGIYYDSDRVDYEELNDIARQLDDSHREGLVCREGEWGNWVNCGGWLVIHGCHVDLIMRDWSRVKGIVRGTDEGICSCHYQTGHPHGFMDVMYRGELASCKVLYGREGEFGTIKNQAEVYPPRLKKSLVDGFLFESGFSCMFVEKYANQGDAYYLAGHVFRSLSALNQVIFALNEKWLLNEKRAVRRIEDFEIRPEGYSQKVEKIVGGIVASPEETAGRLKELCDEVRELAFTRGYLEEEAGE